MYMRRGADVFPFFGLNIKGKVISRENAKWSDAGKHIL